MSSRERTPQFPGSFALGVSHLQLLIMSARQQGVTWWPGQNVTYGWYTYLGYDLVWGGAAASESAGLEQNYWGSGWNESEIGTVEGRWFDVQVCRVQVCMKSMVMFFLFSLVVVHFFCFGIFGPKNQNCQFELKFSTRLIWICRIM